jgi:glutamate--cysteine ligase
VSDRLDKRLDGLTAIDTDACLGGGRCGVEKESLRVAPDGLISMRPHPEALGSALTNRYITTDFSEALLEFVTPPMRNSWEVIQFLCDIHQFVYEAIDDELLWAVSMPCMIRSEADIPVANYGSSNIGTMKTIYRRGLGHRYGRYMQAISGIHFNYSFPDAFWPAYEQVEGVLGDPMAFRSEAYLGLVRNVRRLDWFLLYLFGASPAVCKTFLNGVEADLEELDTGTAYGRFATSLRMSEIGYHNTNQASLNVSANSLDDYIGHLNSAIRTPNAEFQKIGVKVGADYRQLNANNLQIENEYYSTIRPKRVTRTGERPTEALRKRGVEYVELRALDVSPFDPVGINQKHVRFLEIFSIYCLLKHSPPIDTLEQRNNSYNRMTVAGRGREPGLELRRDNSPVALREWGTEICGQMLAISELLDTDGNQGYSDAVKEQMKAVEEAELTPSARLIAELKETGQPMFTHGMELSRNYADYFKGLAPDLNSHHAMLCEESRESIKRQAAVESEDKMPFEEYLERYFE